MDLIRWAEQVVGRGHDKGGRSKCGEELNDSKHNQTYFLSSGFVALCPLPLSPSLLTAHCNLC